MKSTPTKPTSRGLGGTLRPLRDSDITKLQPLYKQGKSRFMAQLCGFVETHIWNQKTESIVGVKTPPKSTTQASASLCDLCVSALKNKTS